MLLDEHKLLKELDLINKELEKLREMIVLQEERLIQQPYLIQVGTDTFELDLYEEKLFLSRYELEELAFQMKSLGLDKLLTSTKKGISHKRHSA